MAVSIIANGFMGTLKEQRVSTNTTTTKLSDILNNAGIIPPVTNEPNKVFSYWATTISGFDIGDYTISQLYSIGAITKENILNIYANFTYVANSIQVTFNANGGTFPDGLSTKVITVSMGSIYGELESSISVLPTKHDSHFLKWTDPKNNTVNGSYEFTESIVVTAQYSTSPNSSVSVKDSRGKSVITGSFPKSTLWKDLYAQAISNGYSPDDVKKVFSNIKPGYGSNTGQAIKSIDFSVANNPMKVGWLRGSIYEAANADVSLYTNRNLYLNSKRLTDGYGTNGNVKVTVEPFDNTTNMWHIVGAQGIGGNVGIYLYGYTDNKIPDYSDWTYSADIKGIGDTKVFGIEGGPKQPIKGNIGSEWSRISQTGYIDYSGVKTIVMYFDTKDRPLDVYIKIPKLEKGTTATPWSLAPEDINKKIRGFAATTIPVDPYASFAVTGRATNDIALIHNPIGKDEIWTHRNLLLGTEQFSGGWDRWNWEYSWDADPYNGHKATQTRSAWGGPAYVVNDLFKRKVVVPNTDYTLSVKIRNTSNIPMDIYFFAEKVPVPNRFITTLPPNSDWTTIFATFQFSDIDPDIDHGIMRFEPGSGISSDREGAVIQTEMKFEKGTTATPYTPAPEDTKTGLWLNNDWLYNPYTQKWLDTSINNSDYSYSNSVITFKNYFNVQYVTGDISKVRSSVTATVKSVVSGYGSTTDKKPLYNNSYFPSDDSGVTLNVEEYLGYSYVVFYNPATGYSQTIYKQAGTPYSEFLKGITKSKFEAANKYLKGFYVSNYWTSAKLIGSNPINSPIDMAKSDYLIQVASSFTTVFFNANGGVFYKGTSYETEQISVDVSKTDTYGIVSGYVPEIKKRTLTLLYWALDLEHMEPAYPNVVVDRSTVTAKWAVTDNIELYRKPREYHLVDASTIIKGWDQMDKFSLSDKNNIFVIDPEGNGASYDTSSTYTSNGWGSAEQELKGGTLSFDAYYNGYDQYNRLGRWMRGRELAMVRLDETGIPTYWMVKPAEIERTEIKHNEQYLKGKLSFTQLSPPFDLEFLGIGTDNIIDNEDDMFRRNAYVYIHSLKIPDRDAGVQIMAQNGSTTIEDSVEVDFPGGSYFEYSTIPFKERWKYGPSWSNMPNNLYNNIVNLAVARPIILGIGKWELSVSSSNKVTITSLKPHKIQDYAGKTIDSLGGLGPFMGIAIKEKEF